MQESICFAIKIGDKICNFFLSLYRSPSQDEFETFTENFELNLENLLQRNPFLGVAIKDFNAKSNNWFYQGNAGRKCNWKFNIPVWIAPGD